MIKVEVKIVVVVRLVKRNKSKVEKEFEFEIFKELKKNELKILEVKLRFFKKGSFLKKLLVGLSLEFKKVVGILKDIDFSEEDISVKGKEKL